MTSPIETLIDDAIDQAGSLTELSRTLDWPHSNLLRSRREQTLSPYRAAQLALLNGVSPALGVVFALKEGAKSDAERAFWENNFKDELVTHETLVLKKLAERSERNASLSVAEASRSAALAVAATNAIAELGRGRQ